ncbi:unnamed protein product [Prorocentrum cordatum]|uniref:Uncharacterized protein n=1 Tax=Prorocentrum cordatum TaxID=2364126 RepID=A0ABN9UM46_9DINO|nr:unnamed protein product [Polarella glacialis]
MLETCSAVLAMQEEAANYPDHAKGKKDHDLGPPYIDAKGGALKTSSGVKIGQGGAPGFTLAEALQVEFRKTYMACDQWSVERKCDLILHCRVEKVYQRGMKKITVATRDPQFRILMNKAFASTEGAVKLAGRAPATSLELELQEWLECMEG